MDKFASCGLPPMLKSFESALCTYGKPDGGQIITKQAAEGLLQQITENPTSTVTIRGGNSFKEESDICFVAKRVWMEGTEESGQLMVEYERIEP